LPVVFAAILFILVAAAFASFAWGAYLVFNHPVSNVVAITDSSSSKKTLVVSASGLSNSTERTVWIDPQIVYDSNGNPTGVVSGSGYLVGNTTTDVNGDIFENFSLSLAGLSNISNDGRTQHSVWIIGVTGPSGSTLGTQQVLAITPDSEQNYSASSMGHGIILFALLYTFPVYFNFTYGQLFLGLWTVYLIMFGMALNGPFRSLYSAVKESVKIGVGAIFDNSLLATMAIFTLVLWGEYIAIIGQSAAGVATGSLPVTDGLVTFIGLTIAPLREEIGFRVIPIGVAAFILLLSRRKVRDAILSLWHPMRYLKRGDTPSQYRTDLIIMYIMFAISASVFGAAHFLSGGGWGPGKILDAAIGGVGFAALYYRYGLPAAVLGHWAVDYFLYTYSLTPALFVPEVAISWVTLIAAIASAIVLLLLFIRRRNAKRPFLTLFYPSAP
jgi:hypothetical protein